MSQHRYNTTAGAENKPEFKHETDRAKVCLIHALDFLDEYRAVYLDGALYVYTDCCYREVKEPENFLTRWMVSGQRYVPAKGTVPAVLDFVRAEATPAGFAAPKPPFFAPGCKLPGGPGDYIPFRNGLLDVSRLLRDGRAEVHPHTPDFVSFYCLPYAFDPGAACPRWDAFLGEALEGDGERTRLLQEWFGYCLTDDVSQQKFMLLLGMTRAGKGTTSNVLGALVGEENYQAFEMGRLVDRFSLASLRCKQLAIIGEVELSGVREKARIVEKFKSITGNDPQTIERKGVDVTEDAVLPTRFMLSANQLPPLHDVSGALDARMLLVKFDRTASGREDLTLLDKLKGELSGIANWALEGLRRLRSQGWTRPQSSIAEKTNFRRLTSVPLAFLQDACVVHRSLRNPLTEGVEAEDEVREIDRNELHTAFTFWADDNELERATFSWFCRDVRAIIPNFPEAKAARVKGVYRRLIRGVRVRDEYRTLMEDARRRLVGR